MDNGSQILSSTIKSRFLDKVYWLQYELKCIGAVKQAKPMGSNINRIIVTNTFSRDTVTKSQRIWKRIFRTQETLHHQTYMKARSIQK